MEKQFTIPEEYEISFRRVLPYLSAPLQNDAKVLEALVLYFKLGGEKMARIVIDALNVTHRMEYAAMLKRMREEAMIRDLESEESESEEDGDGDDDGDDDDQDEEKEGEETPDS